MASQLGSKRFRARWVVGSLALHALLGLTHYQRTPSLLFLSQRTTPQTHLELDVDFELPLPEPEEAETRPQPDGAAARGDAAQLRAAPRAAASVAAGAADMTAEAADAEPADAAGSDVDSLGVDTDASQLGPRLSLTELGVGEGNPFVDRGRGRGPTEQQKKEAKARAVKRRLDRALAQGLLDHDSARGHGAGSPVMRLLEAATYASAAPNNGNASFTFVIDSEGKVVSGSLGAVSSDREAWERVARQAVRDLAGHKLRVPKGKGVKLTVQVTSRVELPSGADPGVEVRAFGVPLKRGGGERSTRVDLLNPLNPLSPLSLMGDPADIGATARRMVRAHVTSEELL